MPYVGDDWPDIDPSIVGPYTYDFSQRLATGDSISFVVWNLSPSPDSVYTAPDPNSESRLFQSSTTSGTATTWVSGGVPGVRYRLTAFIGTVFGMSDDLYSYIKCNSIP